MKLKKYLLGLLTLGLISANLAVAQTQLCDSDSQYCVVPNDFSVGDDVVIGGDLGLIGTKGTQYNRRIVTTLLSPLSGATAVATSLIPAGSIVYGCVARVTTTITGATSFTFGDGTTATKWGTGIALPAGTVTSSTNWVAATTVATSHPLFYTAAVSPTLTATGSNFTAGAVRVTCLIENMTGPTS